MPVSQYVQNNFTSGELSPLMSGRIDLPQYANGCETAENVLIVPQGGMRRRPGTAYVGEPRESIEGISSSLVTYGAPNGTSSGFDVNALGRDEKNEFFRTNTQIGVVDPYVVATMTFDVSAPDRDFIDVERPVIDAAGASVDTGAPNEFYVESSSNGTTWDTRYHMPSIPLSGQTVSSTDANNATLPENTYRFTLTGDERTRRFWRIVKVGGTQILGLFAVSRFGGCRFQQGVYGNFSFAEFSVSPDRNYLVEFGDTNISIYRTDGPVAIRVADIDPLWNTYSATEFTETAAQNIRTAQIENVMLVVGNNQPSRLVYLRESDSWLWDKIPFVNVPHIDFNDDQSPVPRASALVLSFSGSNIKNGDRFVVEINGVVSRSVSYNTSFGSMAVRLQDVIQSMPIFADDGIAVQSVVTPQGLRLVMSGASSNDFVFGDFQAYFTSGDGSNAATWTNGGGSGSTVGNAPGVSRKEPIWSDTRGWPRTVTFYEGRLAFGGTHQRPATLMFSKSGSFFDFDTVDTDDDDGILATISSRNLNTISDIYPGRNLQIFTGGAEFAVTSRPLTPGSVAVDPQTSHGATPIEAVDVDGSTFFVDRYGRSLLSFLYSFNEDAYTTNDVSVLSSHLIKQPKDMALLSGTASDDANWLMIVNDEGDAAILNTLRSQEISGFTHWIPSGGAVIRNAVTIADKMFFLVSRNGTLAVEQWDFGRFLDGSSIQGATNKVISGLDRFPDGTTVRVIARSSDDNPELNYILGEYTVSGGQITLTDADDLDSASEFTNVQYEVGTNFTPLVKTMPINTNVGTGINQMSLKKIVRANIRVHESLGIHINGIPVPITSFGSGSDSPLAPNHNEPTTGIIYDWYDEQGWGRDVSPLIGAPLPTPFHIQLIEYEITGS